MDQIGQPTAGFRDCGSTLSFQPSPFVSTRCGSVTSLSSTALAGRVQAARIPPKPCWPSPGVPATIWPNKCVKVVCNAKLKRLYLLNPCLFVGAMSCSH